MEGKGTFEGWRKATFQNHWDSTHIDGLPSSVAIKTSPRRRKHKLGTTNLFLTARTHPTPHKSLTLTRKVGATHALTAAHPSATMRAMTTAVPHRPNATTFRPRLGAARRRAVAAAQAAADGLVRRLSARGRSLEDEVRALRRQLREVHASRDGVEARLNLVRPQPGGLCEPR